MTRTAKAKAEARYAEIQKRTLKEQGFHREIDAASRLRMKKTQELRQLRLAKEAQETAEKQAGGALRAKPSKPRP